MKNLKESLMLVLLAAITMQAILTPPQNLSVSKTILGHPGYSGVFFLNPGALQSERRLNEDLYDDAILFGTSGATTRSIEEQSRADEMGGVVINFNRTYNDLRRRLETYRRYSAGDIPDDIRVAALNAYIENAIIMQNLGVLEEEEEQADQFGDYYQNTISPQSKVRKNKAVRALRGGPADSLLNVHSAAGSVNARAEQRNAQRDILMHLQQHSNSVDRDRTSDALAPASLRSSTPRAAVQFESLDRANGVEFGAENILQGESGGAFGGILNSERRLRSIGNIGKPSRRGHRRLEGNNNGSSLVQRLRQGDALLELAREGNLFNIDFNAVYDLSGEEIPNDLGRGKSGRALRRGQNFKI